MLINWKKYYNIRFNKLAGSNYIWHLLFYISEKGDESESLAENFPDDEDNARGRGENEDYLTKIFLCTHNIVQFSKCCDFNQNLNLRW